MSVHAKRGRPLAWSRLPLLPSGGTPTSREGHSMNAILTTHELLVFGGLDNSRSNQLCILNIERKQWSSEQYSVSPPPRAYHAAWTDPSLDHRSNTYKHKLYIHGGQSSTRESLSDCWVFERDKHQWRRLFVFERPSPREGHSANLVGKVPWVFGGASIHEGVYYNDVWTLDNLKVDFDLEEKDLCNAQWQRMTLSGTPPSPRMFHGSITVRHKLFLFGGVTKNKRYSDELFVLDTYKKQWFRPKTLGTPPSGRSNHAMSMLNHSTLLVHGGKYAQKEHVVFLDDLFILDLDSMHWSCPFIGGMAPSARYGHATALVNDDEVYVFGGLNAAYCKSEVYVLGRDSGYNTGADQWTHVLQMRRPSVSYPQPNRRGSIEYRGTSSNARKGSMSNQGTDSAPASTENFMTPAEDAEFRAMKRRLDEMQDELILTRTEKTRFEGESRRLNHEVKALRTTFQQISEDHNLLFYKEIRNQWLISSLKETAEKEKQLRTTVEGTKVILESTLKEAEALLVAVESGATGGGSRPESAMSQSGSFSASEVEQQKTQHYHSLLALRQHYHDVAHIEQGLRDQLEGMYKKLESQEEEEVPEDLTLAAAEVGSMNQQENEPNDGGRYARSESSPPLTMGRRADSLVNPVIVSSKNSVSDLEEVLSDDGSSSSSEMIQDSVPARGSTGRISVRPDRNF
eukprot:GILJ01009647.1.p1 GENE.GILJ01009647.1~~GILJ01009647.1.p1  ORF type:complete len:684 (+),score=87.32 GILJ01009647.1:32-2083(+)